jgi:hypothetical protein
MFWNFNRGNNDRKFFGLGLESSFGCKSVVMQSMIQHKVRGTSTTGMKISFISNTQPGMNQSMSAKSTAFHRNIVGCCLTRMVTPQETSNEAILARTLRLSINPHHSTSSPSPNENKTIAPKEFLHSICKLHRFLNSLSQKVAWTILNYKSPNSMSCL